MIFLIKEMRDNLTFLQEHFTALSSFRVAMPFDLKEMGLHVEDLEETIISLKAQIDEVEGYLEDYFRDA